MMKFDAWSGKMKEVVKIGTVELFEDEAEKLYSSGKYIMTSSAVYQIFHSKNAGYYGQRVHYKPHARYTRPGRFHTLTAKEINNVLGFTLLNE